jgi:hypothetical protein
MKQSFSIRLTRAQFDAARYRLVTQHLVTADANADHGKLAAKGVTLNYAFDGVALHITIEHKPLLFTEGFVEGKIRDWFSEPATSHRDPASAIPSAI